MRSLILLIMLVLIQTTTGKVNATDKGTNFTAGITIVSGNATHSNSRRYTCSAARVKITIEGYDNIKTLNCSGSNYQFISVTKGINLLIVINSRTGTILSIKPV